MIFIKKLWVLDKSERMGQSTTSPTAVSPVAVSLTTAFCGRGA